MCGHHKDNVSREAQWVRYNILSALSLGQLSRPVVVEPHWVSLENSLRPTVVHAGKELTATLHGRLQQPVNPSHFRSQFPSPHCPMWARPSIIFLWLLYKLSQIWWFKIMEIILFWFWRPESEIKVSGHKLHTKIFSDSLDNRDWWSKKNPNLQTVLMFTLKI